MLPASDDAVPTLVQIDGGEWLTFQDYFVLRGHTDVVRALRYRGAEEARPARGVVEALEAADLVIIAPSNPPLSILPMLAIPGIGAAVRNANRVVAVSPLIGGKALKGPAERVLASLGFPPGNAGVLASYEGLISDVVVDIGDATDVRKLSTSVMIHATNTRLGTEDEARRFAEWFQEAFA